MYNSYQIPRNFNNEMYSVQNSNDDRLIAGGFLGPFLLGGITGGLVSPLFYNNPRPYYNNNYYYPPYPRPYPPYPRPYPPYRPY